MKKTSVILIGLTASSCYPAPAWFNRFYRQQPISVEATVLTPQPEPAPITQPKIMVDASTQTDASALQPKPSLSLLARILQLRGAKTPSEHAALIAPQATTLSVATATPIAKTVIGSPSIAINHDTKIIVPKISEEKTPNASTNRSFLHRLTSWRYTIPTQPVITPHITDPVETPKTIPTESAPITPTQYNAPDALTKLVQKIQKSRHKKLIITSLQVSSLLVGSQLFGIAGVATMAYAMKGFAAKKTVETGSQIIGQRLKEKFPEEKK